MKNTMMIYGHLIDGNTFSVSPIDGETLIKKVWTDDFGVPPEALIFDASTESGERVRIVVPFSKTQESYAIIGNPQMK